MVLGSPVSRKDFWLFRLQCAVGESAVVCAAVGLDAETLQESRVQCLGSVRDESVIDEVVRILLEDLKKKPMLNSRSVRRRLNSGIPTSSTYAVGERRRKAADAISATGIKFVAGRVAIF